MADGAAEHRRRRPDGAKPARLWAPALVYAAILTLSSRSSDDLPDLPGFVSYLGHAVEYGVLAVSLRWAVAGRRRPGALTVVVITVLAVIDESFQSTIPGRDPSALDVVVDLAAAVTVVSIWRWRGKVHDAAG